MTTEEFKKAAAKAKDVLERAAHAIIMAIDHISSNYELRRK
jgi:hypothetical protein